MRSSGGLATSLTWAIRHVVSVASLWEIVVKIRVGKLQADIAEIVRALEAEAFEFLPIQPAHLETLSDLPLRHRDPFDHLLIAQAIAEDMTFMTEDRHAPLYPVRIIGCAKAGEPRDAAPLSE